MTGEKEGSRNTDGVGTEILSVDQAARYIGVNPRTIRQWAEKGELPTTENWFGQTSFDRKTVNRFAADRARLMTISEVARFLDVKPIKLEFLIRIGKLTVASRTTGRHRRFDRAAVEAFARTHPQLITRTEDLTSQEAGEIIGVSTKTIQKWAKGGKLPSTARTPHGHWLFEKKVVEAVAESRAKLMPCVEGCDNNGHGNNV